ncbi:type II secretion system F family protein [Actibacterium sp. XHP0104]|uniref:type II secretion system F family protein n=1 Tax=Actibacterium sp. XHP0104 TaxID=2984335 RepID=UPI0021E7B75E|nr:type II secretion system F family protein [Actibacterium sp. XHP0104]MCV2882975.1 type II secretion system F family protein [Actibacterium sp. XHP0104]
METAFQDFLTLDSLSPDRLALIGLAIGVFLFVYGMSTSFAGPSPRQRRLYAMGSTTRRRSRADVLRLHDNDPKGLLRALVPQTQKERSAIAKRLRQAGIHRRNAIQLYYIIRTALALLLPALFLALLYLPQQVPLPGIVRNALTSFSWGQTMVILSVLMLFGFFLPAMWLHDRIKERRLAIERSLPNALDLIVVALEAGMGFDAAMTRVAHEIAPVAPAIADEFTILQLEIQAGKDRQRAFLDLAARTGVEEVSSFANVVVQSLQFGTSVADALSNYAKEMRLTRELKAQEKANKLPVKMSAVLAGLMMPVLMIICLTPILIRWLKVFGNM